MGCGPSQLTAGAAAPGPAEPTSQELHAYLTQSVGIAVDDPLLPGYLSALHGGSCVTVADLNLLSLDDLRAAPFSFAPILVRKIERCRSMSAGTAADAPQRLVRSSTMALIHQQFEGYLLTEVGIKDRQAVGRYADSFSSHGFESISMLHALTAEQLQADHHLSQGHIMKIMAQRESNVQHTGPQLATVPHPHATSAPTPTGLGASMTQMSAVEGMAAAKDNAALRRQLEESRQKEVVQAGELKQKEKEIREAAALTGPQTLGPVGHPRPKKHVEIYMCRCLCKEQSSRWLFFYMNKLCLFLCINNVPAPQLLHNELGMSPARYVRRIGIISSCHYVALCLRCLCSIADTVFLARAEAAAAALQVDAAVVQRVRDHGAASQSYFVECTIIQHRSTTLQVYQSSVLFLSRPTKWRDSN
jgi:hypothetical protein